MNVMGRVSGVRDVLRVLVMLTLCAIGSAADVPAVEGRPLAQPEPQGRQQLPPRAQGPRGPRQAPAGAEGELLRSPVEIQRMLDGYALLQAQEVLQLSDEQSPRFLTRMIALQETRRRTLRERRRIMQELRRMTEARSGTVDEATIKERMKMLDDLDGRSAVQIRQAHEAVDQVLDAHQQARFRVFEQNMEQRKLNLLMRARQASRGRRQF